MKLKTYNIIKITAVILFAVIAVFFTLKNNFIIPVISFVVLLLLIMLLGKSVKERTTDERIHKIAGRAANLTMSIALIAGAIAGLTLTIIGFSPDAEHKQVYYFGIIINSFVCFQAILYTVIYHIVKNKGLPKNEK